MFNKSNFCHIASNNRNEQKGSVFIYKTSDTLAQVTQSGYFNEKLIDINVHDLIIHVQYDPVARTLKKSVLIVTERTADNVKTEPILDQTIGDDIADLGDQVQGIEEKIPENASPQNQLATKNQITDLQNSKQDKATAINYDNITNCITEIPQDIKLELANGVLTLKAGSKLYHPNGEDDFNTYTTSSDISTTGYGTGTRQMMVFVRYNSTGLDTTGLGSVYSGSDSFSATGIYYNTTTNDIDYYTNGSATGRSYCFPIAIITMTDAAITSIDQVFNGFGYMGSTEFVLPGMDGLSSYGFNDDGTYNNLPMRTTKVKTLTVSGNTSIKIAITTDGYPVWYSASAVRYDKESNRVIYTGTPRNAIIAGEFDVVDGRIQNFKPYKTFRAVDYNDFEELDNSVVHNTGDETIGGTKTFTNNVKISGQTLTFTDLPISTYREIDAYGDTGKLIGSVRLENSGAATSVRLVSRKRDGSEGATLAAITANDGSVRTIAVTPNNSSNSVDIATTAWANAKFLQLAGGTMSGIITSTARNGMKKNVDDSYLEFYGGTSADNAAFLRLDGKDSSSAGQFTLATSGGSSARKSLNGRPDGTLNWGGKPVVTTEAKSLAQNGYYKFNNGLIIQWGELAADSSGRYTVNFPTAFTSTNYTITAMGVSTGKITTYAYVQYGNKTTTNVQLANVGDATDNGVRWMAIGY